ncbi:hypothetical protein MMC11_008623, partial [Xylographa trunciseda]|nr:hypothetical protein [Xylographa trunciseda]
MAFAPPVSHDHFHYNGALYVTTSSHNRHPRASVAEITALLRPALKGSKTRAPTPPPKDPVGHWYEAQLVHYGLPVSKSKAVAKTRLLDALNKGVLAVPGEIHRVEEGLRREWEGRERKARREFMRGLEEGEGVGKRKGREMEDEGVEGPVVKKVRRGEGQNITKKDGEGVVGKAGKKAAAARGGAEKAVGENKMTKGTLAKEPAKLSASKGKAKASETVASGKKAPAAAKASAVKKEVKLKAEPAVKSESPVQQKKP